MIKICGKSICKSLPKIFEECLRTGTFSLEWKSGNIAPNYKTGNKQIYKNYWLVSLMPMFGKILERLIFEEICPLFMRTN